MLIYYVVQKPDYSKYDNNVLCSLSDNWPVFDALLDSAAQWRFIHPNVTEILAVMCPYKRVHSRVMKKSGLLKKFTR